MRLQATFEIREKLKAEGLEYLCGDGFVEVDEDAYAHFKPLVEQSYSNITQEEQEAVIVVCCVTHPNFKKQAPAEAEKVADQIAQSVVIDVTAVVKWLKIIAAILGLLLLSSLAHAQTSQLDCITFQNNLGATVKTFCSPFKMKAGSNITFSASGSTLTIAASGSLGAGFDTISAGTNTTAAMVVGTGATLSATGSGTIAATTSAALAANPADCTAGQYATAIAANGDLTCAQVAYSQISSTPTLPANTTATTSNFFTAYNSTTGAFTKAQPAASDITGLAASATTDTTSASNISSGTLNNARLDAELQALAAVTLADDGVIVGDSASAATVRALPSCSNATTSKLLYNSTTNAFSCGTDQTGGASASPGGSDTQVQFNDGGTFGGDAGLVYDKTTDTLTVGTLITTASGSNELGGATPIIFEGATADAFETTVSITDPTADRTFTIPNADSVAVQPDTGASNNFLTAISAAGVISKAQPSSSNLSDAASLVKNNAANTYSTGAQDFGSASSLKVPTAAGASPTASGQIAYDSTANAFEAGVNGANKAFAMTDSNITGNAATATALAANPSDCSSNQFANAIAASGNLTCAAIADADVPDTITASNYLPLAGGTMTGQIIADNLGIEFDESDTNPTCAAGNFNIYADLSENKLKKCMNGTVTDLDTAAASGLASTDIDTSAELRAILTDEDGTGALFFAGGNIGAATATTASANDNDTSVATTAYVQTELTDYAADTVAFTNKTYNVESTGNVFTSVSKIWLEAAACQNTTASLMWDTPTSNPAVAACVTGTNTQKGVADFADGASELSMQRTLLLPDDWTGNIDAKFKWLTSATTGNVVWKIYTICVADAETDDPAFNTASTVTDAAKGTTNQTNDASITSVTVTGCAAGELMHVKVGRDPANASDTLAATARLIGVELTLRRAQ